LLHQHVPVFKSHHVPARFLYPAVMLLALVLASGLGALVSRLQRRHRFADAALAACALALAVDVAAVAQKPMKEAMWMRAPDVIARRGDDFHFEKNPPWHYKRRDWAGPMYLAMLGRTGVLNCYGAPPFEGRGALAVDDPGHRGEVVLEPGGRAALEAWSPNAASVAVSAAPHGARLVYNMNFDPGWHASVTHAGERYEPAVESSANRVSVTVPEGDSAVRFFYRPPGLRLGLLALVLTCALLTAIGVRRRRAGAEA
jgi:hypothetical protein